MDLEITWKALHYKKRAEPPPLHTDFSFKEINIKIEVSQAPSVLFSRLHS